MVSGSVGDSGSDRRKLKVRFVSLYSCDEFLSSTSVMLTTRSPWMSHLSTEAVDVTVGALDYGTEPLSLQQVSLLHEMQKLRLAGQSH